MSDLSPPPPIPVKLGKQNTVYFPPSWGEAAVPTSAARDTAHSADWWDERKLQDAPEGSDEFAAVQALLEKSVAPVDQVLRQSGESRHRTSIEKDLLSIEGPPLGLKVIRVQRFEHRRMWRHYLRRRDEEVLPEARQSMVGLEAIERMLWHGTRATSPEEILLAPTSEGLDERYSSEHGLYGRALYFAENPLYPIAGEYCHFLGGKSPSSTTVQLILARVATGQPYDCGSSYIDRNLVVPPRKLSPDEAPRTLVVSGFKEASYLNGSYTIHSGKGDSSKKSDQKVAYVMECSSASKLSSDYVVLSYCSYNNHFDGEKLKRAVASIEVAAATRDAFTDSVNDQAFRLPAWSLAESPRHNGYWTFRFRRFLPRGQSEAVAASMLAWSPGEPNFWFAEEVSSEFTQPYPPVGSNLVYNLDDDKVLHSQTVDIIPEAASQPPDIGQRCHSVRAGPNRPHRAGLAYEFDCQNKTFEQLSEDMGASVVHAVYDRHQVYPEFIVTIDAAKYAELAAEYNVSKKKKKGRERKKENGAQSWLWKEFLTDFLAGGISGALAKTMTAPIERLKLVNQLQAYAPNAVQGGNRELYSSTLRFLASFWAGNIVNVLRYFPTQAFNFAFQDTIKALFPKQKGFAGKLAINVASGGLAGAGSLCIVYPLDLVRTVTAIVGPDKRGGIVSTLMTRWSEFGLVNGWYSGFLVSVLGIVPFRGTYFGVHDFLTDSLIPPHQRKKDGNLLLRFFIAQTAALLAGYSSYPFDTVRRAKQLIPHRTYSDICRQLLSLVRRGVYDSDRAIAIIAAAAALWPGSVFAWKTGRFGGFRFRHFWLGLHAGLLGVGLARLGFFTGTGFFAGCQQNSQRIIGSAIVLVSYGEVKKLLG